MNALFLHLLQGINNVNRAVYTLKVKIKRALNLREMHYKQKILSFFFPEVTEIFRCKHVLQTSVYIYHAVDLSHFLFVCLFLSL